MTEAMTMSDTCILKIDLSAPDPDAIETACDALNRGELVVCPTETQYGILARVDNAKALEKLFRLKGRDPDKPSSIFIRDVKQLNDYAVLNPTAQLLADRFFPGPLTLVLASKEDFGKLITKEGKTGFRVSSNLLIHRISEQIEFPITATSANFSGSGANETAARIQECFGEEIAVYLDGGEMNSLASTVVEVVDDKISILREGAISKQDILAAIR